MSLIANLEWANYAATRPAAEATPEVTLTMRDDVIITTSDLLPMPDANHACLLRSESESADALIDEVIAAFHPRGMPATVYVSPACLPADLPARLELRGFALLPELEAWMTLDMATARPPEPTPNIPVRAITRDEAGSYATVFLRAFELPLEYAPVLERMLRPSIGLDNARHYMAFVKGEPVGTMSLLVHEHVGVIGSAGVLPSRKSRHAAMNLIIEIVHEARRMACETLMLQTTADTILERLLHIKSFNRVFTRTCYVLPPPEDA